MIDAFLQLKDGTLKRSQDVEELFRMVEEAGDGWNLWLDLEAPHEEAAARGDGEPIGMSQCGGVVLRSWRADRDA